MIQNKYVIGVLGGAGAGKSTVLKYLSAAYQVDVVMADETGHILMRPGKSVYLALIDAYGEDILSDDGTINREKLAKIAFKDEESQKKINEIEHPLIKEEIINTISRSYYDVVFLEAALLIEGGLTDICDEIWLISASEEIRKERLMKDRGYSEEKCLKILSLQKSDSEFKKYASLVISNNRDINRMREEADYYMSSLAGDLKLDLRKY